MTKLTVEILARAKELPAAFLRVAAGLCDAPGGGVLIPYHDIAGEPIAEKRRTSLVAKEGSFWPKGAALAAYGQWRLDEARKCGRLYLVEGESDCWALWYHGFPALGLPGSNTSATLRSEHLDGIAEIYAVREPDESGGKFITGVRQRLRVLGYTGKAFEVKIPDDKDPADLHVRHKAVPGAFERAWKDCVESAVPLDLGAGAKAAAKATTPASEPWDPPVPLSDLPPAAPFPLGVFPDAVRQFVEECAWACSCPPDFAALPVLGVAGGAIGNSRRLAITRTHTQSAILFLAIVGPPGSKKSPVLDLVREPLEHAERRYYERYERDCLLWEEGGEKGPRPRLQRAVVDDYTTEDLMRILRENPRGVTVVKDELAGLVCALNQYKANGRGSDRQVLLSLYAGVPITVDRKHQLGIPMKIPRPHCCIVGAIQPAVVEALRQDAQQGGVPVEDGFADRFLPAYPERPPAVRELWREVSEDAAAGWAVAVERLLALEMVEGEGGPRPYFVRLDASGRTAWEEFTQLQADEINSGDLGSFLEGIWSKLTGACGRLALVLHCLWGACEEGFGGSEVSGGAVEAAAGLVAYFKAHIRRTVAAMDLDPAAADARRVLAWVERERPGSFKRWQLHKDIKSAGRFPDLDSLKPALRLLVQHNYLRAVAHERSGPGRPETDTYEVNPEFYSSTHRDNRDNRDNCHFAT